MVVHSAAPYISSLSGELSTKGGTAYGARIERGDYMTYELIGNIWIAKSKTGLIYTFGKTEAERMGSATSTIKWMLTEIRDMDGNSIIYTYEKDHNQIYPKTITWTNFDPGGALITPGIFKINFIRVARQDPLISYRMGLCVITNYQITKI